MLRCRSVSCLAHDCSVLMDVGTRILAFVKILDGTTFVANSRARNGRRISPNQMGFSHFALNPVHSSPSFSIFGMQHYLQSQNISWKEIYSALHKRQNGCCRSVTHIWTPRYTGDIYIHMMYNYVLHIILIGLLAGSTSKNSTALISVWFRTLKKCLPNFRAVILPRRVKLGKPRWFRLALLGLFVTGQEIKAQEYETRMHLSGAKFPGAMSNKKPLRKGASLKVSVSWIHLGKLASLPSPRDGGAKKSAATTPPTDPGSCCLPAPKTDRGLRGNKVFHVS